MAAVQESTHIYVYVYIINLVPPLAIFFITLIYLFHFVGEKAVT